MKNVLLITLLFLSIFHSFGQSESEYGKKYFLIAASTKNYSEAIKKATSISKDLNLKLKLRDLIEYKANEGLTWNKSICEEGNRDYPCYFERGNADDGNYISIEWSSAYKEFTKGLYLVVVSSQTENNSELKLLLIKTQTIVPNAFIKSAITFQGCLH